MSKHMSARVLLPRLSSGTANLLGSDSLVTELDGDPG